MRHRVIIDKPEDIPASEKGIEQARQAREDHARRMAMIKRQQAETWKRMNS